MRVRALWRGRSRRAAERRRARVITRAPRGLVPVVPRRYVLRGWLAWLLLFLLLGPWLLGTAELLRVLLDVAR